MMNLEADGVLTIYDINSFDVVAQYEDLEVHEIMSKVNENESIRWFLTYLPLEKQLQIIKPHYEKWYNDQQIAVEMVRGDIG